MLTLKIVWLFVRVLLADGRELVAVDLRFSQLLPLSDVARHGMVLL